MRVIRKKKNDKERIQAYPIVILTLSVILTSM